VHVLQTRFFGNTRPAVVVQLFSRRIGCKQNEQQHIATTATLPVHHVLFLSWQVLWLIV